MSVDPTGLSEADLELLVDYTAGALTGVQQDRVDRLIQTDDRWAEAHADVLVADAAVSASLRALPAAGPMPSDIAARVDAALAAAAGPTPGAGATVLAFPVDRARRRRLVMTMAGVAAVAVVVVGGITVASQLAPRNDTTSTAGTADREQAPTMADPPGLSAEGPAAPRAIASGLDYRPDTLSQLARADLDGAPVLSSAAAIAPGTGRSSTMDLSKDAAPASLHRLADPAALTDCLAAIGRVHVGLPRVVDYATFEDRPAVLVLLRQGAIATVVVVGPGCGVNGADERYAANVH